MSKFQSTKVFDGYSCVFRQWRASDTRCKYLHGYSVSFKVWFDGELDYRNWVLDFGIGSRAKGKIDYDGKRFTLKEFFNYMFDHTVVVAEDDPALNDLLRLSQKDVIQLRIVPAVGAERFAEFVYKHLDDFVVKETKGRVRVAKVEFSEHNKNSAIYIP